MDYSQYPVLEFRRKFFKIFGAEISIVDPASEQLVGYIKMKMWSIKGDVRVYTDRSTTQEIVRIGGRQKISMQKVYDVFDSTTGTKIASIRQKSLRSFFVRDHMDILDANDNIFADVQETSGNLAIIRRWIAIIPYIGPIIEIILMFVIQTFTINYDPNAPQLIGNITHKKNPFIVKMTLDTTNAKMKMDARLNIAIVSLLSVLDASKNK